MPRIDARNVDEASDFTPIPEGEYPSEVDEVEVKKTKSGDEMWSIRWTVFEGQYTGRSFYDNLVFSEAALSRVKLVAKRVARLDVDSGPFDFEPDDLNGKRAMVDVEINTYKDKDGKERTNNKPKYGGYDYYHEGAPEDRPKQEGVSVRQAPAKPTLGAKSSEIEDDIPF